MSSETNTNDRYLEVGHGIQIPMDELQFNFARSSGPGGQNVNKVNSKAQMRWQVLESDSLSEPVRNRLRRKFGNRINREGELILQSDRFRDQPRNVAECLDKLKTMIQEIATPPARRKPTAPSRASKRRRLENKRKLSEKKSQRRQRFSRHD
ncbi:Class I peptide chain release factor [Planctomycetales bacterium 10988]|nr:Class I peptide chain release factor [Planctomycetales bacterium 10988]